MFKKCFREILLMIFQLEDTETTLIRENLKKRYKSSDDLQREDEGGLGRDDEGLEVVMDAFREPKM